MRAFGQLRKDLGYDRVTARRFRRVVMVALATLAICGWIHENRIEKQTKLMQLERDIVCDQMEQLGIHCMLDESEDQPQVVCRGVVTQKEAWDSTHPHISELRPKI